MKTFKSLKATLALGMIAAVCAFGLTACSVFSNIHGVAATVNGVDIKEDDVTQLVTTLRAQQQLTSDEQWGLYLAANEQTPSSVRDAYIGVLRDRQLAQEGAKELGITVDSSEVEMQIQSLKANFSTDAAWKKSLSDAGWTEEEYRAYIESQVLSSELQKHFEESAEATDEQLLEAAKLYVPYYYDGKKRTSHILFQVANMEDATAKAEARAKAQEVLDRINAGTLSFEDAVQQYSDDSGTKANNGDVGYDSEDLAPEYRQGYADLEVGQISGLVESQFGFHIIKVTDKYEAPEEITSLDQVPEAFRAGLKEAALYMQTQNAYSEWLQGLRDAAKFTQNGMPAGLPYDLDIAKYQKKYEELAAQYSAAASESAESESTEGSASSESTSSSSAASSGSASSSSASSESSQQ